MLYNCPDCQRRDTCDGCPRTLAHGANVKIEHIPPDFPDSFVWPDNFTSIPSCCLNCNKHPINGGDGECTCDAPLFSCNPDYTIKQYGNNVYYINYKYD